MTHSQQQGGIGTVRSADDVSGLESETSDERSEVVRMEGGGVVGLVASALIRMVIAPAIRDGSIPLSEDIHLQFPAPIVPECPVNEDDRIATSLLDVLEFCSIDLYRRHALPLLLTTPAKACVDVTCRQNAWARDR